MGLYGKIAALIEIAVHRSAGFWLKVREKLTHKAPGDAVCHHPAAVKPFSRPLNGVLLRNQPDQIVTVAAETQVYTAIGIQFNIKVTAVVLHGRKEELKAAVLAGRIQNAGIFRADIGLLCPQPDIQAAVIIAHCGIGRDGNRLAPKQTVDGCSFNAVPIKICGFPYNCIFTHGISLLAQFYRFYISTGNGVKQCFLCSDAMCYVIKL